MKGGNRSSALLLQKFITDIVIVHYSTTHVIYISSTIMYNNDVGQESAQKFMKQTGDLKAATLYFAS